VVISLDKLFRHVANLLVTNKITASFVSNTRARVLTIALREMAYPGDCRPNPEGREPYRWLASLGKLSHGVAAKKVSPRIANLSDVALVTLYEDRRNRRAHSGNGRILTRCICRGQNEQGCRATRASWSRQDEKVSPFWPCN
jgi:hypothetical protein